MQPILESNQARWITLFLTSLVLSGMTLIYGELSHHSPSHLTFGAFMISGRAASQHLDPYAIWPGIWAVHPYIHEAGPLIYDRNLQPPILLPLFQEFARLSFDHELSLWLWSSFALFVSGTAALLKVFRERFPIWLIPITLLSDATLSTFSVGEGLALFFALAPGAVCFPQLNRIAGKFLTPLAPAYLLEHLSGIAENGQMITTAGA